MKKIVSILLVLAIGSSIWYLFIKPEDYKAKIKSKTSIGTINQSIKLWNTLFDPKEDISQNNLNDLTQKLVFNDSIHTYSWHLDAINDTLTKINISIKDESSSISGKIKNLFSNTDFKKRSKKTVLEFNDFIKSHLERIKITIDGVTTLPQKQYAYTVYNGPQNAKVTGMMKDLSYLENVLVSNKVALDGPPFIKITHWDMQKDSISYQFAFPIIKTDSLPVVKDIKYSSYPEQKVIKATYNGNYITSDRAWYGLLDYANTNNITVDPKPIEVFYNNPNMGGDEMTWKTEVFLPIIEN